MVHNPTDAIDRRAAIEFISEPGLDLPAPVYRSQVANQKQRVLPVECEAGMPSLTD
jgi:hypothetical protein